MNPLTYTQSACSQHYKDILHLNQSHFLAIRIGLIHNSMVSLQDNPIWFSERKLYLKSTSIDLYTKCLFPTL